MLVSTSLKVVLKRSWFRTLYFEFAILKKSVRHVHFAWFIWMTIMFGSTADFSLVVFVCIWVCLRFRVCVYYVSLEKRYLSFDHGIPFYWLYLYSRSAIVRSFLRYDFSPIAFHTFKNHHTISNHKIELVSFLITFWWGFAILNVDLCVY